MPLRFADACNRCQYVFLLGARASRPQRTAGAKSFWLIAKTVSRFALTAGGTPALPVTQKSASGLATRKRFHLEFDLRLVAGSRTTHDHVVIVPGKSDADQFHVTSLTNRLE